MEDKELRRPVAKGGVRPARSIARAAALVSIVGVGWVGKLALWPLGRPRVGLAGGAGGAGGGGRTEGCLSTGGAGGGCGGRRGGACGGWGAGNCGRGGGSMKMG